MRTDRRGGSVVISVDIPADQQAGVADVPRLLDLFDRLGIAATWALAGDVDISLARKISDRTVGHELAMLVDSDAIHGRATRGQVARYIISRQEQLAAAELSATSLIGQGSVAGWLDRDVDLLAKHGITTIRFGGDGADAAARGRRLRVFRGARDWLWASSAPMVQPESVRFGVWSLAASMNIPDSPVPTGLAADVARACRSVEAAAVDGGLFHLVVGLEQLIGRGSRGESSLEAVLKRVAEARSEDRLDVVTASGAIQRFAHPGRTNPAAHSILRPKAA